MTRFIPPVSGDHGKDMTELEKVNLLFPERFD